MLRRLDCVKAQRTIASQKRDRLDHGLKDGGFSAEFSVEEHEADGVMETEFYLPDTFPTRECAFEAAIQAGRQKIDMGFERGSAVVNG